MGKTALINIEITRKEFLDISGWRGSL